jgi:hypothetical protein
VRLFHKDKGPGYDAEALTPAIKKSICTGEAVAGFVDRRTGRFIDVVLIRSQKDLDAFRAEYNITDPIKTIW